MCKPPRTNLLISSPQIAAMLAMARGAPLEVPCRLRSRPCSPALSMMAHPRGALLIYVVGSKVLEALPARLLTFVSIGHLLPLSKPRHRGRLLLTQSWHT